jgi:hypothetical protein
MELVRYEGNWYKIIPKPYEPERQTYEIAWMLIKNTKLSREEAYRLWYKKEQEVAKVLYPSFRKDGGSS